MVDHNLSCDQICLLVIDIQCNSRLRMVFYAGLEGVKGILRLPSELEFGTQDIA